MTEALELRAKLQGRQEAARTKTVNAPPAVVSPGAPPPAKAAAGADPAKKADDGGFFGGFKKGFLVDSEKTKPKAPAPTKAPAAAPVTVVSTAKAKATAAEDMPFISPKNPGAKSGVLPEVQEAMSKAMPFLQEKQSEWLTPALLEKIAKSDILSKGMANPRFMAALKEFQTNPGEASQKYQSSPEIGRFFQEYFKVMGEHFTDLGDKEQEKKAEGDPEQQQVNELLKKPEVREALQDPQVQALLKTLKENPNSERLITARIAQSETLKRHVEVLYKHGLLGIARNVPAK